MNTVETVKISLEHETSCQNKEPSFMKFPKKTFR